MGVCSDLKQLAVRRQWSVNYVQKWRDELVFLGCRPKVEGKAPRQIKLRHFTHFSVLSVRRVVEDITEALWGTISLIITIWMSQW